MPTYYVEGIHYADLTDLLSDGWAEDKTVAVHTAYGLRTTTVADLREPKRLVAVANEGFAERTPNGGFQYAVAVITEDSPGWTPEHWYPTLPEAQLRAREYNRKNEISQDEVLEIQISSMRASKVR